jgi:type IV secretion system protein TrbG
VGNEDYLEIEEGKRMPGREYLVTVCVALLAVGCVAKKPYAPPPPPPALVAAQPIEDAPPAKVEVPATVRLVDELPVDIATATRDYLKSGKAKIIDRTSTEGFAVYPYGHTRPKVQCRAFASCAVELEPGEIVTPNGFWLGDSVRWSAAKLDHGEGPGLTRTILLKPNDNLPGLETEVRIGTNRRKYVLWATYGTKQTINLKFWYPDDITKSISAYQTAATERQKDVVASGLGVDLAGLHMNYRIDCGDGVRFCPTWVADDGHKTYMLLPPGLESIGIPSLYLEQAGEPSIINYNTSKLPYYIIERVFDRAVLQMGTAKNAQRVTITREG